MSVRRIMLTA